MLERHLPRTGNSHGSVGPCAAEGAAPSLMDKVITLADL